MNLSPHGVIRLPAAGFEAEHWSALGSADASEVDLMEFAARRGYVVVTHDLEFGAILAATQGRRSSVVQLPADNLHPDVIGDVLTGAIRQMSDDLVAGALLTVEPPLCDLAASELLQSFASLVRS